MTRVARFVTWVSVLSLGTGIPASADPVTITNGSIVLDQPGLSQAGPIVVAGTRGFAIQGVIDSGEGVIDPLRQCFPCEPTADFSVGAELGTFAIVGSVSLDGKTYHDINNLGSNNLVFLQLIGTTALPPVDGSSVSIHAPFTVGEGSFFTYEVRPGSEGEPPELATVALRGRGTATVSFLANPSLPSVWEFREVHYDFAPVPEPSTLILIGGGLAASLLRARRRRTRSDQSA